jgi:hypothetical protein
VRFRAPAGVERILTVSKFKNLYDPTVAEILVAGTTVDTGESLYYGCVNTTVSTKAFWFQMQIFHQRYW